MPRKYLTKKKRIEKKQNKYVYNLQRKFETYKYKYTDINKKLESLKEKKDNLEEENKNLLNKLEESTNIINKLEVKIKFIESKICKYGEYEERIATMESSSSKDKEDMERLMQTVIIKYGDEIVCLSELVNELENEVGNLQERLLNI